jgi:hypothetical protein
MGKVSSNISCIQWDVARLTSVVSGSEWGNMCGQSYCLRLGSRDGQERDRTTIDRIRENQSYVK